MTDDSAPLYADRDSIHPRAFAVRHMVIEEVKARKRSCDETSRARLDRVARGVDVAYDASAHEIIVSCEGAEVRRLRLDDLDLYHRGDSATAPQQRGGNPRQWDSVLEANRRLARTLVDAMLARMVGR